MVRQIIIPTGEVVEIKIPASFKGKKIEVLAFEIENETSNDLATISRGVSSEDFFAKHRVDLSDFKFNREEANDYE